MTPDSGIPPDRTDAARDGSNDVPPHPPLCEGKPTEEERRQNRLDVQAWRDRNGNAEYVERWDPRFVLHLPLLSRFWGYDDEWFRTHVSHENLKMTLVAGRRLTFEELDLCSFYASKGVVAASYDRPFTLATTAMLLWRGASTFRLPFYQPKFVRVTHPQLSSRPFLSTMAWHGARIGAYGAVACAAHCLLASKYRYHVITMLTDEALMDPGLSTLFLDMQEHRIRLDRAEFEREQRERRG